MTRVFLVVMDSVGIGGAPDAEQFFNGDRPDTGANTLGHIAQACEAGQAEIGRTGPLTLPTLSALGLGSAVTASVGQSFGLSTHSTGTWGVAREVSRGKDTPSGHWELAGVPVPWDWHVFPNQDPAFPDDVTEALCKAAGTPGILANRYASGTEIIETFGSEHLRTGWPICYTSVDSVLQIAAHEEVFGLDRLYEMCQTVAPMLHARKLGRVIARPFLGGAPGEFARTKNRKDFAIDPPEPTLCDWVSDAGRPVYAIGKIGDIFSMRGITTCKKGRDRDLMVHLADHIKDAEDGSLTFANFVEFDSEYGHRRDVSGYARHLEWFDTEIGRLRTHLRAGDVLILTADHGNDPTWTGTDHTREQVPVLVDGLGAGTIGQVGFADVGSSVAHLLGVPPQGPGQPRLRRPNPA